MVKSGCSSEEIQAVFILFRDNVSNYYVKIVLIKIRIIDEVENVRNAILVDYTVFEVYKLYLLQHINQTDKSSTNRKHPNIYFP